MSTINKFSTVDEVIAAIQEERFPAQSPRLQSLTEAHAERICPGWDVDAGCVNGGDELDPGQELCRADEMAEERFYQREMWAADGESEFIAYPHLTDQGEELREVVAGQAVLMKMIR